MKFSKNGFPDLDLSNLLINIWTYADHLHDPSVKQYEKWCVELAKEKWQSHYLDFGYVIEMLKEKNKEFYDFGKISAVNRRIIYKLITQPSGN